MTILNIGVTKKMRHPESDICKSLWTWFQFKYPMHVDRYLRFEVKQTSKRQQVILKAEGNKAGTSDILIAIVHPEYGGLWLEVKADKGRMSKKQQAFQIQMTPDYLCRTGYGIDECTKIVTHYMSSCGLTRGRLLS